MGECRIARDALHLGNTWSLTIDSCGWFLSRSCNVGNPRRHAKVDHRHPFLLNHLRLRGSGRGRNGPRAGFGQNAEAGYRSCQDQDQKRNGQCTNLLHHLPSTGERLFAGNPGFHWELGTFTSDVCRRIWLRYAGRYSEVVGCGNEAIGYMAGAMNSQNQHAIAVAVEPVARFHRVAISA